MSYSSSPRPVYVLKRNGGGKQALCAEKVRRRMRTLCGIQPTLVCDVDVLTDKVMQGVYAGVSTSVLDDLVAQTAAYRTTTHPDYGMLAGRLAVSTLHKLTHPSFAHTVAALKAYRTPPPQSLHAPLVSEEFAAFVASHAHALDAMVQHHRDYTYDYFAVRTLEKGYLLKLGETQPAERPQYMLLRVAAHVHMVNGDACLAAVQETYELLSRKIYTHATPTLFNAGTPTPQLSSCFLLPIKEDSVDGIYATVNQCANISRTAGGIGLSISNVRAAGAYIKGTGGRASGLVPLARTVNALVRHIDQGSKRKGAVALYLEPWHADVEEWLDLKLNNGADEIRARDLFFALWVPDLFMQRVKDDAQWTLFSPDTAPGLHDVHSEAFKQLYERYEAEGRGVKTLRAQALWMHITTTQIETGSPYMLFKDACNAKSNQSPLGTIRSSNLCAEIVEFSSPEEVAVCNLASINLAAFVLDGDGGGYDYEELARIAGVVTRNLNRVIDRNFYPVAEARTSNMRHRPIGIGVQGWADALFLMKLAVESDEAREWNRNVAEAIYFGALQASMQLAKTHGAHASYADSLVALDGKLQFDLWGVTPSERWPWGLLRASIHTHGLRNSLLVALMPTASSAQIMGNCESFEPVSSNLYVRRVLSGEFILVNRHLVRDLEEVGLWSPAMRDALIAHNGSVQRLAIPDELKARYKTVWECSQRSLIDMSADRGAFTCQSQSFNIHMAAPSHSKLTSALFYAWQKGLKTGLYYLRTRPAAAAIQFTVDASSLQHNECVSCGS